ncbi:MAG: alpha/beta fold hydrolase [Anaerolineae bacterium]|nr:alpha/beta fold hydrolase [Anaerolineae bacterium]
MNDSRFRALLALVGAVLLIGGCAGPTATPTTTPGWLGSGPILAASATVNPVLPSGDGSGGLSVGASNPTQAALAAEGQPSAEPATITPEPTAAWLPMAIGLSDGLVLRGTFYGAPVRPAPGVLMLPMEGGDRTAWDALAERLQALGYHVLTVDLRGYGDTGGRVDWALASGDVQAALDQLTSFAGVNTSQIVLVGAGIGANLALNACADLSGCAAAVLLSPGLDYQGITTAGAMARLGVRPVLIVASDNDGNNPSDSMTLDAMAAGDHQLVITPAAGHGTEMFTAEPGLLDLIAGWLPVRVPPPAPGP